MIRLATYWLALAPPTAIGPGADVEFRADQLEVSVTDSCPDGRILADGRVELRLPGFDEVGAHARKVEWCATARHLSVVDFSLHGPRLRFEAERGDAQVADDEGLSLNLEGLSATPCACDAPPWHIRATGATVRDPRGAWVRWPVLWVGPVPLAAAPMWYVPFERRRTGFLAPRFGWHGDDGPYGALPFFWATHRSVDLTLSPGWRATRGAMLGAQLRWADRADDESPHAIRVDGATSTGIYARGRGALGVGPLQLALEGTLASDGRAHDAFARGVAERSRDHHRAQAVASAGGSGLRAGVRAAVLRDRRRPVEGDEADQAGVRMPAPVTWLTWTQPWARGAGAFDLDAELVRLDGADVDAVEAISVAAVAEWTGWWGPLRMRPSARAGLWHQSLDGDESDGGIDARRIDGAGGLELRAGGHKRFGAYAHQVLASIEGQVHETRTRGPETDSRRPTPPPSRRVGGVLSNRLTGRNAYAQLDVAAGYEAASPHGGREPARATARLDHRAISFEGAWAQADDVWTRWRVGATDGLHLRAGWTRADLDADAAWQRRFSLRNDLPQSTDVGFVHAVDASVAVPWGRWTAEYGVWRDIERSRWIGQHGALRHRGRCDCWSLAMTFDHQRGRRAPDIAVAFALSGPP